MIHGPQRIYYKEFLENNWNIMSLINSFTAPSTNHYMWIYLFTGHTTTHHTMTLQYGCEPVTNIIANEIIKRINLFPNYYPGSMKTK